MSTQARTSRFVPFDRCVTSPQDVVQHLVRNEAYKVMRADRKAGLAWSGLECNAAFRYLKSLTHGVSSDYSDLKSYQINALQAIFMYTCYFERERSLHDPYEDICLPGMCMDWYNELFDDAAKSCERTLRHLKGKLSGTNKKFNPDKTLSSAVNFWRNKEHLPEVKTRLAEQEAREASESTEANDAEMTDEEIAEVFAEVTPEQIIALSS